MLPQIVQFTTYLIDLDGVVYRGEELIPGAKEFVNWLNSNHKKYLFLTNNSFASETQIVAKLTRLGIPTDGSMYWVQLRPPSSILRIAFLMLTSMS